MSIYHDAGDPPAPRGDDVNIKDAIKAVFSTGHATTNQKEVYVGNEDNTATSIATMMAAKQQALNDQMRAYSQMANAAGAGGIAGGIAGLPNVLSAPPPPWVNEAATAQAKTPFLRPTIKGIKNGWLIEANGEDIYCADIAAVGAKITAMLAEFSLRE